MCREARGEALLRGRQRGPDLAAAALRLNHIIDDNNTNNNTIDTNATNATNNTNNNETNK